MGYIRLNSKQPVKKHATPNAALPGAALVRTALSLCLGFPAEGAGAED